MGGVFSTSLEAYHGIETSFSRGMKRPVVFVGAAQKSAAQIGAAKRREGVQR